MEKKKKALTERQELFLDKLTGEANGDLRTAMTMAGYSEATGIREAIRPIQDDVIAAASMMMAVNAPKAAASMVGLLTDPNVLGARNLVAASKEILDRAGVVKKETLEIKGADGGLFILPPKQDE
tara:strand:- start:727 stop:1101 length:375 start_codon:yes stop_codon:yes gene_type:complete